MSTEITVRGSFTSFESPERGTVHATIAFDGPAMEPVYDRVARDLDAVKASITALHNPTDGPVTWWSAQNLRTWSSRPWNKDGKQLPPVYHATVSIEAKFRDFTALSRWVSEHIANTAGFRVSHVEWTLTTERRDELHRQARTRAVQDSVTRAQQYADALELGKIRPVAVADAGMLVPNRPEGGSGGAFLRAAAAPMGGAAEVELQPEDIEVSADIDARFVVEDA